MLEVELPQLRPHPDVHERSHSEVAASHQVVHPPGHAEIVQLEPGAVQICWHPPPVHTPVQVASVAHQIAPPPALSQVHDERSPHVVWHPPPVHAIVHSASSWHSTRQPPARHPIVQVAPAGQTQLGGIDEPSLHLVVRDHAVRHRGVR